MVNNESLNISKTDSNNVDFMKLIKLLDDDLNGRYGELQKQYNKYNKVDYIKDVININKNDIPAACGALKKYNARTIELNRIFVVKENRRKGFSKLILLLRHINLSKCNLIYNNVTYLFKSVRCRNGVEFASKFNI